MLVRILEMHLEYWSAFCWLSYVVCIWLMHGRLIECIYIFLTCLIVLMHNSSALCSGNLLVHINWVAGITWLIAWEKVGPYLPCVFMQSDEKDEEYPFKPVLNTNTLFAHSHSKCTLSSLTINYSYSEKILRGHLPSPLAPLMLGPTNCLNSIWVYFRCKLLECALK